MENLIIDVEATEETQDDQIPKASGSKENFIIDDEVPEETQREQTPKAAVGTSKTPGRETVSLMILGILSGAFAITGNALMFSIAAIIIGVIALKKSKSISTNFGDLDTKGCIGKTFATVGLIFGIVRTVYAVIVMFIFLAVYVLYFFGIISIILNSGFDQNYFAQPYNAFIMLA